MKNMNFPWAGKLHRRAGRQAALQNGPVGYTLRQAGGLHSKLGSGKGRAGRLPFSATRPALFHSQPDHCSFVQPTGPPFYLLCSPLKVYISHWETRPSSPPGPPALQLVLSYHNFIIDKMSYPAE